MNWVKSFGTMFVVAASALAFCATAALADDQPKYATMRGSQSWSPPAPAAPQQPIAQQIPQQPVQRAQPVQQAPVKVAAVQPMAQLPVSSNGSVVDYRLGTGDKVRVTVYGEEDLSGEFQVDSTGMVRLPIIGQVRAAGQTAQVLESAITASYGQGYLLQPRVNVEVTSYRPFYIIGEVNKPGEYPYVNGMSVLNAVALAGGYTAKASEGHVWLRKNGTAKEVKIAANQDIQVMPGDIVRVSSDALMDVLSIVSPFASLAPRL